MIRRALTLLWLLFPVGVLAFHFNYGDPYVQRERAAAHLQRIHRLEAAKDDEKDWAQIITEYDNLEREVAAIEPPRVIHQIRLARAKARLEMLDIATAITDLTTLLQETAIVHGEDAPVTRSVRETLGKAHYYATCLLQANNAAEAEWRPYAERARQLFRFLAEHERPGALAEYEERVRSEFDRAVAQMPGANP
jgi:hypothetical protein